MKQLLSILATFFYLTTPFLYATTNTVKKTTTSTVKIISQDLLIESALKGKTDLIEKALKKGFPVDFTDAQKRTLLMYAAFNGHTNVIQLLINKGADVNATDLSGSTPLMFAASGKNLPAVKLLVKYKAKVNAIDSNEHWTPLMWAAAEGQIEVVHYLLEKGADPLLKDVDGDTAESFAKKKNHQAVANMIRSNILEKQKEKEEKAAKTVTKTSLFGQKKSISNRKHKN